ncbi:galactose-1-phosphate uridylyltransferase [Micrococcales bacterium 31B]|nr:galactose-1-phosphate uridylyltransferase [Micrococcales bacterium 31B]
MTQPVIHRYTKPLADGRTLLFFDDSAPFSEGRRRDGDDLRDLPAQGPAGLMRLDQLTGEWVSMAPHRNARAFMPPADECPLCPTGRGTVPSEIPTEDYDVVAFGNRSASFTAPAPEGLAPTVGGDLFEQRPALGHCEVMCFTSDHEASLGSLPVSRLRTVIEAWADRTEAINGMEGVEQVFCFENRGKEIGVTLQHPHGQIYGYPFLTPRTRTMLERAAAYRATTGRRLLDDIVAAEIEAGERIIIASEHWVAYVPAAARWPVEIHLAPRRCVPDLAALTADERDDLAVVYKEILQRADRYYVREGGESVPLPYIAAWHQAPVRELREEARLHLQLFSVLRGVDRVKYLAGSESAMGAFVSDTTPEKIAARLREVASV